MGRVADFDADYREAREMPHEKKTVTTTTTVRRDAQPSSKIVKTDPNSGSGAYLVAPVQLVPSK